ncbi:MAG TPA: hypothetical protein GXX25_01730 [Desulfotomaculum sp.]|nr:hypothetical protein [Desulfotomaculum sp.]
MSILPRVQNPFQIIREIPLPDVARRYGLELRRAGSRWVARCPFHDDSNPSLVLFPDGRWRCFGCQAHGDAVDLVARLLNLRPIEAARRICLDFGLPVDRPATPEAKRKAEEAARERQLEAAFKADLERIHQRLAMVHRNIFRNLRTFEDYERLSDLTHIQPVLEYVLDELTSRDPARQVAAWRYVRRWFLWLV